MNLAIDGLGAPSNKPSNNKVDDEAISWKPFNSSSV
jgi:hypothetical protein